MRKLIESTFVTLNGVIDEPQNWSPPYWDDEHMAYNQSLMEGVDAQVLGRAHLRGLRRRLAAAGRRPGRRHLQRDAEVRRLPHAHRGKWNAQPLEGDAAEAVRKLKESDGGDLIKYGTGEFSKALLENKLVDEYHFWIFPVVAEGATMFQGSGIDITHLELLGTTTFKSGIVVHKLGTEGLTHLRPVRRRRTGRTTNPSENESHDRAERGTCPASDRRTHPAAGGVGRRGWT